MSHEALSEQQFGDLRSLSSESGYERGSYERHIEEQLRGKHLGESPTRGRRSGSGVPYQYSDSGTG